MTSHILRNEFEAGEGSFLISLRVDLLWDAVAFDRLCGAMEQYCREVDGTSETLERWVATGFWYVPNFVRSWTSHPNFPPSAGIDFDAACQRLDHLAICYFEGTSPDEEWLPT